MKGPQLTVAVLVAATLAGCAGGSDGTSSVVDPDLGPVADADTGALEGRVIDESQLPIPDAHVAAVDAGGNLVGEDATDDTGAFLIPLLPPGDVTLRASASGYIETETSESVQAGEITDGLIMVLEVNPAEVPYTFIDQKRFTIGGFMVHLGPGDEASECTVISNPIKTCTGVPTGCQPTGELFCCVHYEEDLNPEWVTVQGEAHWTPQSGFTGRSTEFEVNAPNTSASGDPPCGSVDQSDPHTQFGVSSDPPFIIRWDKPHTLVERGIPEEDWCCDWWYRLWPGWCDLGTCDANPGPDYGLTIEQTVDVYFSVWFREIAPEDWSAAPTDT